MLLVLESLTWYRSMTFDSNFGSIIRYSVCKHSYLKFFGVQGFPFELLPFKNRKEMTESHPIKPLKIIKSKNTFLKEILCVIKIRFSELRRIKAILDIYFPEKIFHFWIHIHLSSSNHLYGLNLVPSHA